MMSKTNMPFKIVPNPLSDLPVAPCEVDDISGMPFKVPYPLPQKNFAMLVCGPPGSGKTNFWLDLIWAKGNKRMYRGLFHNIFIWSGSMQTLPDEIINDKEKGVPVDHQFEVFDPTHVQQLIQALNDGPNEDHLLIFDDMIADLNKCPQLAKLFYNRRHAAHDRNQDGKASISIIVTTQKFNKMHLDYRAALSHLALFGTMCDKERAAYTSEFMTDITNDQREEMFEACWPHLYDPDGRKHGFIFMDLYKSKYNKYFQNFNKIIIPTTKKRKREHVRN